MDVFYLKSLELRNVLNNLSKFFKVKTVCYMPFGLRWFPEDDVEIFCHIYIALNVFKISHFKDGSSGI